MNENKIMVNPIVYFFWLSHFDALRWYVPYDKTPHPRAITRTPCAKYAPPCVELCCMLSRALIDVYDGLQIYNKDIVIVVDDVNLWDM